MIDIQNSAINLKRNCKSKPISIYIHWPFCLSLCPYCDFNSHVGESIDHDAWLACYLQELIYFTEKIKGRIVKSIFFGGGTPSLMKPKIVEKIITKISSIAFINEDTEITLEANPTSYEAQKFCEFKTAGINRVSIGVQSFCDERLKFLGRKHSAKEGISAITSAAALFDRYSFDLIYASQNQTLKSWQDELRQALPYVTGHISLYQLTIEKGTPFFKLYKNNNLTLPTDDLAADMYEWTNEYLLQNNYKNYEISNYALESQECLHNLCYWNYDEYIGIGPGAHSRIHNGFDITALMMIHKPQIWLDKVSKLGHGIQTNNVLLKSEVIEEIVMMGTRLSCGLTEQNLFSKTELRFWDILDFNMIEQYQKQNLIAIDNTALRLTNKGLLLHSHIIPRILL